MKHRVFIAVNLQESVKKRLTEYQQRFNYLLARQSPAKRDGGGPARWTKEPSLHLTLVFIGYVSDEQMLEICRAARKVAAKFEPFFIDFKKIILGPPDKPPRMIWLEGETSKELGDIKSELENALLNCNSGFNHREKRLLRPHITLARIKMEQWRRMESVPKIDEEFQAQVPVENIEVMESDLKRDGAEYAVLESCALKE